MIIFCKHKLGVVQKDGYQYCEKCGKAFSAPKLECNHKWAEHSQINVEGYSPYSGKIIITGIKIILQCSICGELKERSFEAND